VVGPNTLKITISGNYLSETVALDDSLGQVAVGDGRLGFCSFNLFMATGSANRDNAGSNKVKTLTENEITPINEPINEEDYLYCGVLTI